MDDVRQQILRLGPWHLDVQVTPEISTRAFLDAPAGTYPESTGRVSFLDARRPFQELLHALYPGGLDGRSVLDCACNCGGYLFWAREMGAGSCFGFDVREHWIEQARFLAGHRGEPGVRFDVCDLYDLPRRGLEPFDVTLFKGIFYHLPDPITGMRIAADLTREVLIVNTASRAGLPDGLLAVAEESREQLMSGVYGLNWFPTGPAVLERVLRWLGFAEVRCTAWHRGSSPEQAAGLGRIEVVAARRAGLLDRLPDVRGG